MSNSRSAEIRGQLRHPVTDSDGHFSELMPVFFDYLKEVGCADLVQRYQKELSPHPGHQVSQPTNTAGCSLSGAMRISSDP